MASPQQQMSMDDLPGDVLSNILTRLLARQLAQMRCISKSLNSFLSQSSFIKSHLQRSIRKNDGVLLFFNYKFSFRDARSLTARPSRSPDLELTDFIKLPINLQSKNTYGNVIGSVNGLICFTYGTVHELTFYIWNPSLSAVLTLPPSSFATNDYNMVGIPPRFGYDPKTDDYKLVKVTRDKPLASSPDTVAIDCDPKSVYKVEIYSMRKGFWRLIPKEFPSHILKNMSMHQTGFCVNGLDGFLHWFYFSFSLPGFSKTIVAFDLGEETFRVMPLPDSLKKFDNQQVLGGLGGKLCVMSCVFIVGCEVWVMEEYGMAESWVKHHVFQVVNGEIIPYGFTFQNEFLFEDANYHDEDSELDCSFSLYHPVASTTKCFEICPGSKNVVEYVDSLVWVAPVEGEVNCCSFSQLKI
ncbi:hypothetical protein LXL04_022172 [Taraxacum kok-saghyz]